MKYIITALLLFVSGLAHGQAGYLDKTFGDGGIVTVKLESPTNLYPFSMRILPNGDIMHCGIRYHMSRTYAMKHHSDGSVDSSFGYQGTTSFQSFGGFHNSYLYFYSDGRFLVFGDQVDEATSQARTSIVRFHANGMIDSGFGINGRYIPDSSYGVGTFYQLKVNNDGSIIALGSRNRSDSFGFVYAATITHITPEGKNDITFGSAGTKIVGAENDSGYINNAFFTKDDRCVFSYSQLPFSSSGIRLFSTHTDGTLDTSFGTNGFVDMQFSDDGEYISSIIEDADGKLICLLQMKSNIGRRSVLLRFFSNGTIDNSFGEYGVAPISTDAFEYYLDHFTLDSSMAILAAGSVIDSMGNTYPIIARYHSDGTFDSSHGTDGIVTEMSKHVVDITSVAVQSDGKYVVTGYAAANDGRYIGKICRINPDGKLRTNPTYEHSSSISVYPTPSTNNCTVTYTLPSSGECTMSLRDESGRQVKTFVTGGFRTAGEHKEELDLRGLAAGVYFLQIESNGTIQTEKLIKQ
jgi:uncharacterized delta-60 repeat protein